MLATNSSADDKNIIIQRKNNYFLLSIKGAAIAAGRAVDKWDVTKKLPMNETIFQPKISEQERDNRYKQWKMAVERSLGWDI